MPLTREQTIAVVGGAVILIAFLLLRRPAAENTFVTGPSEATGREIIRAGIESERIEAGRQVDLADIFSSAFVDTLGIESRERISSSLIASEERVDIARQATSERIAGILTAPARIRAEAESQRSLFDSIGSFITGLFSFF